MSRTKRRERRDGQLTLPLGVILFGVFAAFIVAVTVAVSVLMIRGRELTVEHRAELPLARVLESAHMALKEEMSAVAIVMSAVRESLESSPEASQDPAALRAMLIPSLRFNPAVDVVSIRHANGRAWEIMRDGDTWLTRRTVEGDADHNTVWERWDRGGVDRMNEQPDGPMPDVVLTDIATSPATKVKSPAESLLPSVPGLRWGKIAENPRSGHRLMPLIIEVRAPWGEAINVVLFIKLSRLTERMTSLRESGPESVVLALADGTPLAPASMEGSEPLQYGLDRILRDTFPPESVFTSAKAIPAWWYLARFADLGGGKQVVLLAGVPESALFDDQKEMSILLAAVAGVALFVAVLLAVFLSRMVNAPLREFTRRARRVDILDRSLGYRPHSRLREVDQLYETLDDVYGDVADRLSSREMPLVISAQPVKKLGIETSAALLVQGDQSAATTMPPQEDELVIPEAFLQAIQATRRKLRQLSGELEAERDAARLLEENAQTDARRWESTRAAAAGLSELFATEGHDFEAFARSVTHLMGQAADVARVSVWQSEGDLDRLVLLAREDRFKAAPASELTLDSTTHSLFFSTLRSLPMLSVREAVSDPRSASYVAAIPGLPPTVGLMALPVRVKEAIVAALVLERPAPIAAWPASTEALANMVAAALAASFELAGRPGPQGEVSAEAPAADEDGYVEPPVFRHLLESASGAVIALDRAGRVTYVNTATEHLYGRPAQAWPGMTLPDLAAAGFAERDREAFSKILDGEMRVDEDTEHVRPDGTSISLRLVWSPLETEDGDIEGAVIVALELQHTNEHLNAVKQHESRYREYVEGLAGIFFSLDCNGIINYVSPSVQGLHGYLPATLTGESMELVTEAGQYSRDRAALEQLLHGGVCNGYETIHRSQSGEPIHLIVYASVRRDSQGIAAGITGVAFPQPKPTPQE